MSNSVNLIDRQINPFIEEAIIKTEKEIEAAQITAAVFLKNYADRVSPEVIKTAQAIESGDYLANPVLVAVYGNIYSRLLQNAPSGVSAGRFLNNLYRKLFPAFRAAGVIK